MEPEVPSIEDLSEVVRSSLLDTDPTTEEFSVGVNNLKVIEGLKPKPFKERIDFNSLTSAVASLAGIGMILNYEKLGIVTSKAIGFVSKIRL